MNPVLGALGLGFAVYGQRKKREAEAEQLRQAAKNLYTEAAQTQRQGEYMAFARALELEQRIGAARTAAATSGVQTGRGQSVSTGIAMTETFGRLDVDMERLNAARRARGLREQARQAEEAASELAAQGTFEDLGTILGGAASLFG